MYKFEMHLHTSTCSKCGASTAEEMIDAAKEHGYSGIVLTNHFYRGNTCIDRELEWEDFVGAYAKEYEQAVVYGKERGITVFFGLEEGYGEGKEVLIYGVSPQAIVACPEFKQMSLKELSDFVHINGGVIVSAHPFRDRAYIIEPDRIPDVTLFDGIEVYNIGNRGEENEKAFALAVNHRMLMISGSDVHGAQGFGKAGIAFSEPVETEEQFLKLLKTGDFRLITHGKVLE